MMNVLLYHHLQKMEPFKPTSKSIKVTWNKPDYKALWSLFGWLPIDTIKETTYETKFKYSYTGQGSKIDYQIKLN